MEQLQIKREECTHVNNFGVELELVGVDKIMLTKALELLGIECRYEGYTHDVTPYWKMVSDCSIRGLNAVELVSPILNGVAGLQELQKICKALDFVGASVNASCGFHVHHEALGLTDGQKTNLMKYYARLERTIDAFMPKSRKRDNNNFCKSMVTAFEHVQGWQSLSELGRYYKLNFACHSNYGTIEFRQHAGTTEWEKIYNWIVFTAQFTGLCKDKVSRASMNYIERAWTPKHLDLSKRCWSFFKTRMKALDDLDICEQRRPVTIQSLIISNGTMMQAQDIRGRRSA